jgi:hypothetical protein
MNVLGHPGHVRLGHLAELAETLGDLNVLTARRLHADLADVAIGRLRLPAGPIWLSARSAPTWPIWLSAGSGCRQAQAVGWLSVILVREPRGDSAVAVKPFA